MIHLRSIEIDSDRLSQRTGYPYDVPVIRSLQPLRLRSPVTIFVGENGTGKSTLLSGIATAANAVAVADDSQQTHAEAETLKDFAKLLKLTWSARTKKGFFLRAEDFILYIRRLSALRADFEQELRVAEQKYKGTTAQGLAKLPFANSLAALQRSYGDGLEKQSHGESFLNLFQARLAPNGLYLLDEPETPLSPVKQLALIAMMKDMERADCQFLIATHSPLLMAYPGACLLSFDGDTVREAAFDELDHVRLTRDFLNQPEQFLRHL